MLCLMYYLSSGGVCNIEFQNTNLCTVPCRQAYTSNKFLQWEEDPSRCCVTLEGRGPSLCLSVIDGSERKDGTATSPGNGGISAARVGYSTGGAAGGLKHTSEMLGSCVPSTSSLLSLQAHGPEGGSLCSYKVVPWTFHLPPSLPVSPPTLALCLPGAAAHRVVWCPCEVSLMPWAV